MAIPNLETAAVGRPVNRLGVSFFPIYLMGNDLPEIATGASSGLVFDELDEAAVPELSAQNPTDKMVLLVEGEHLLGGKQNRVVNVTVLVAPRTKLQIPVSCVERGRWGRSRAYSRGEAFTAPQVRAMAQVGIAASMAGSGSRRGNQGIVWNEVDDMLGAAGVHSKTSAAADFDKAYRRDSARFDTAEELVSMGPLPGQCGIVIAHGRWIAAVDLFGAPHLLAAHWGALIRSHLLELPTENGAPSATMALRALRRFAFAEARTAPGVGLGAEHRVHDERTGMVGHALTLNEKLVHAGVFLKTGSGLGGSRPRRRRDAADFNR